MAVWTSLRRFARTLGFGAREVVPPPAATPLASPVPIDRGDGADDGLARLGLVGDRVGPDEAEALAIFTRLRSTPHEGRAVEALVARSKLRPLFQGLAVAVAKALVDRGNRADARALLVEARDPAALVLLADMLADAGDLAAAVATVERVLVRDVDAVGARERRLAWRRRLGVRDDGPRLDSGSATVALPRARSPFDLVREVARGGTGVVFEAKDRELGRTVALKLYHHPERDRTQLVQEGRVASALAGPGMVRVFDLDPEDGWLALEWASLGALRWLLARASDPAVRARLYPLDAWTVPLAAALARVHAAGWVHHDVKPANVLLSTMSGSDELLVWLADLGSARRAGDPSPPGSLGFVSPERLAGRQSDPRDDVYGFGRVVEEALEALGEHAEHSRWFETARRCTGDDVRRPVDGADLVRWLVHRHSP